MIKGDISPLQYMRAHGNSPGPTHRPMLTGCLSGLIAYLPALLVRYYAGTLEAEAAALGVSVGIAAVAVAGVSIVIGLLYAAVFQRAANDTRSGWLFGSSFGFLIWMLGPVEIWQIATGHALASGGAAIGLFGSYVLYGLVLGSVFPLVNKLLQKELKAV
jgi:hypothetical protein